MKSSSGGPWSIVTRITLPPFGLYNDPFSSISAVDAVVVAVVEVGALANAICGNDVKVLPLKWVVVAVAAAAPVAAAAAAAAAVTDAVDVDDDVHDVDNDLILFNLGQLNFKPQFGRFTLLSLFIGSLANGHLLQHFVEWATFDDDWCNFFCWHCTQCAVPTDKNKRTYTTINILYSRYVFNLLSEQKKTVFSMNTNGQLVLCVIVQQRRMWV